MKNIDIQTLYKLLFADYPDIVTVRQLQVMLGISRHAAYDLLADGSIRGLKRLQDPQDQRDPLCGGERRAARRPGRRLLTRCALKRPSPLSARCSPCAGPDRRCGRFPPRRGQERFVGLFGAAVAASRPIHQTN